MGFLRRLFGGGKKHQPGDSVNGSGSKPGKDKRSWSFVKHSTRDKSNNDHFDNDPSASYLDPNKHAIAVAAATAAVAEAALAAAHAAAEVVRLTSSTGNVVSNSRPVTAVQVKRRLAEEAAAGKIQSAFRGYLARRALRALKALVKLQALVRGHIVRKQTADMLRRMQTLVRLQAWARASRAHLSDNMHSFKSSLSHYPVPEDYEHSLRACSTKFDGSPVLKRCSSNSNFREIDLESARFGSNWLHNWTTDETAWSQTRDDSLKNGYQDDENSDKILEVDTWKPRLNSRHGSSSFHTSHHYLASDYSNDNLMAHESPSKRSSKAQNRTAENSPQAFSASSRLGSGVRRGSFTPTKSECSWGFFSGYTSHPNYMANTESSRAKVRSQSAPRQRLEFDRYGCTRRSDQSLWDAGPNSDRDSSDFRTKAYPTSCRLNRIGSTNLR